MLQFIIPLVQSWLPVFREYLIYLVAMVVLTFVPAFIYSLFRR